MESCTPDKLTLQAWIPEDCSIYVYNHGNITGVNLKDTKLSSKVLQLYSKYGDVRLRRARNERCMLVAEEGSIEVSSYVETGNLEMTTDSGDISVTKRLVITRKGYIASN